MGISEVLRGEGRVFGGKGVGGGLVGEAGGFVRGWGRELGGRRRWSAGVSGGELMEGGGRGG